MRRPSASRVASSRGRVAWLASTALSLGWLGCASAGARPATSARPWPIQLEELSGSWEDQQPYRALIARVRLDDPRVRFRVTEPLLAGAAAAAAEATLVPLDGWAAQQQLDLAVNANFFARLPGAGIPTEGWMECEEVDLEGLSVSEGRVVSPPRRNPDGSVRDPALLIRETARDARGGRCPCQVEARVPRPEDLASLSEAVSGLGSSTEQPGGLLVAAGENRGSTARVQPAKRHPRSAVGVTQDGRQLVLVVVDGRREDWSSGATLPELARLALEAGAWDAVALDGGGSSALWLRERDETTGRIRNRPSDGRVRAVGNALGVRIDR